MKTRRVLTIAATLQHIAVEVKGGVLNVTINRPEARNALNRLAHRELDQLFDAFAADAALHVAVIRGAGDKAFCSGSDLKEKLSTSSDDYPDSGLAGLTHRFDLDKPVLAAVNGHALGGGLEIVLACDLAVAVDHAEFGFPEPLVGLAALSGGIHRLVRQVSHKARHGLVADRPPDRRRDRARTRLGERDSAGFQLRGRRKPVGGAGPAMRPSRAWGHEASCPPQP